jgi:diacylglycerol kinase family enzyme
MMETATEVLGPSAATVGLELVDDQGHRHLDPAVVLVSNNPYSLEPPHPPGTRPRLDGGELGIIVLDPPHAGRSPGRAWTASRLEVTAPATLHAGIDGEAVELTPALEFVIRPGALRVLIL